MFSRHATLAVLVMLSSGSLRADVAPFPSWRLAANGTISRAVQAGSAIYVGDDGRFDRRFRPALPPGVTLNPSPISPAPIESRGRIYVYVPAARDSTWSSTSRGSVATCSMPAPRLDCAVNAHGASVPGDESVIDVP